MMREIVSSVYAFMLQIDERIKAFDRKITAVFKASEVCQRIAKIRGIGPKTSTAMIAAIGNGSDFKNGRHLAAWLGLVPRQHSSGERRVMIGISKRGSQHFRTLLVHGPSRRPYGRAKNRCEEYVGQRTSPAPRLQPRNGGGRQ
jgi:transposase